MGYKADVIRVMIASPSDVAAEREVVRSVIHEWNAIHSEDRGIVLMPVGWESHSFPAMGDRPQAIINKQILKGCDLLVAVFWTKLGTPTGNAASGTAEEIEEHLAAGKPALIYFSSEPVVLDSIDPQQYQALKAFKQRTMADGLIEEYDTKNEFRQKLARQLAQTVIKRFGRSDEFTGSEPASIIHESPRPQISNQARELLLEAVKDQNGMIMRLQHLSGSVVQTNGRNLIESNDGREIARWRSAIDQLERLHLIEDRNGKGEVFYVTNSGFETADRLVQGS
ncbi:DUF4062 domain-containing protein [Mesorhizobium microcysteis]|uniref:DUF4062 domain-containing protein n=2 Tax=Neoaquamicrobium microcysteis TaxID=2682781 RepID=A0A5D4GZL9_9HYPH|nr:DUF4062 domain-containing protein [Mesorhizobium microcysteis]